MAPARHPATATLVDELQARCRELSQRCVLLEMARDEAVEARDAAEEDGGNCGEPLTQLDGRDGNAVGRDASDATAKNAKNAIVPKAQVGQGSV